MSVLQISLQMGLWNLCLCSGRIRGSLWLICLKNRNLPSPLSLNLPLRPCLGSPHYLLQSIDFKLTNLLLCLEVLIPSPKSLRCLLCRQFQDSTQAPLPPPLDNFRVSWIVVLYYFWRPLGSCTLHWADFRFCKPLPNILLYRARICLSLRRSRLLLQESISFSIRTTVAVCCILLQLVQLLRQIHTVGVGLISRSNFVLSEVSITAVWIYAAITDIAKGEHISQFWNALQYMGKGTNAEWYSCQLQFGFMWSTFCRL